MKRYAYTFIQLIAAGLLIAIKISTFAFLFPFILVLLVPFRKWCLPVVFTERELTEVMQILIKSLLNLFCYIFSLMETKNKEVSLMMKLIFMVKFIYLYNNPTNITVDFLLILFNIEKNILYVYVVSSRLFCWTMCVCLCLITNVNWYPIEVFLHRINLC